MSVAIGNFLVCLREEAGASQKDICEGICKVSTYSNYERDERVPDFLTLNRIFERLGYGIVSLSAYVTEKESAYLQWRMDTSFRQQCQSGGKLTSLGKRLSITKKTKETVPRNRGSSSDDCL